MRILIRENVYLVPPKDEMLFEDGHFLVPRPYREQIFEGDECCYRKALEDIYEKEIRESIKKSYEIID